ncbi:hypothetical protein C8E03_103230 [Lachnotalea glycerini]|uniref:Uncharacterized protein n=1 Tax=Lachnotalea glycerini TaxID=1763509 RepID=A0A318EXY4_9FIRM|nr:hypothetical protein [Lachnotalea glycerini]PXV91672.1 hypothetical protein C8E03_103230 [Lachnotalea glycerini]
MAKKRQERRVSGRFYLDDPYDTVLMEKVDKMLATNEFRSMNDLIRQGLNLAYEDCYHYDSNSSIETLKFQTEYIAETISEAILSKMEARMEVHDAKILGALAMLAQEESALSRQAITKASTKTFESSSNKEKEKQTGEISQQAMSFLSGLNAD